MQDVILLNSFEHYQVWIAVVFLCPGGSNLIFGLQNSTPGGVGEPLCRTLSQIIVFRDQDSEGQVWSCDNSLAKTFIFCFLELSYSTYEPSGPQA